MRSYFHLWFRMNCWATAVTFKWWIFFLFWSETKHRRIPHYSSHTPGRWSATNWYRSMTMEYLTLLLIWPKYNNPTLLMTSLLSTFTDTCHWNYNRQLKTKALYKKISDLLIYWIECTAFDYNPGSQAQKTNKNSAPTFKNGHYRGCDWKCVDQALIPPKTNHIRVKSTAAHPRNGAVTHPPGKGRARHNRSAVC